MLQLSQPFRAPMGEFLMKVNAPEGEMVEVQITRNFKHWDTLELVRWRRDEAIYADRKAPSASVQFYRVRCAGQTSNYVGFVSVVIPPGYSLIGNPLHCASNTVGRLLAAMPEGTTLDRFNITTGELIRNTFTNKLWSNPSEALNPGEGCIIYNPSSLTLTVNFSGNVPGLTNRLSFPSGTLLLAPLLPTSGQLDEELGLPISVGDVISLYSGHNEKYIDHVLSEKGWMHGPPLIRFGEAFWIKAGTSREWIQRLPE